MYNQLSNRFGNGFLLKDVIYHFTEAGIIPPKVLRNYMIIKDFDKYLIENKGHVGNTFIDLSVKYNLSEKQAKNIVYKQREKFTVGKNIID
ncbi:MAG: hypothetical protein CL870_03125 [Cytophagia bacterium]|nr:hypothetical protein [Cytophagia bacterium]